MNALALRSPGLAALRCVHSLDTSAHPRDLVSISSPLPRFEPSGFPFFVVLSQCIFQRTSRRRRRRQQQQQLNNEEKKLTLKNHPSNYTTSRQALPPSSGPSQDDPCPGTCALWRKRGMSLHLSKLFFVRAKCRNKKKKDSIFFFAFFPFSLDLIFFPLGPQRKEKIIALSIKTKPKLKKKKKNREKAATPSPTSEV